MMGCGDKQIDVATLRSLLPMWMRTAGFVVDDERRVVFVKIERDDKQ